MRYADQGHPHSTTLQYRAREDRHSVLFFWWVVQVPNLGVALYPQIEGSAYDHESLAVISCLGTPLQEKARVIDRLGLVLSGAYFPSDQNHRE